MRGFGGLHWFNKAYPSGLQPKHKQTRLSSVLIWASFKNSCKTGKLKDVWENVSVSFNLKMSFCFFLNCSRWTNKVWPIFAAGLKVEDRMTYDPQSFMGKICCAAQRHSELKPQVKVIQCERGRVSGTPLRINLPLLKENTTQWDNTTPLGHLFSNISVHHCPSSLPPLSMTSKSNQHCCCFVTPFCH